MPLLYLVRHGETAWNRENRWQGHRDTTLTAFGEAQARAAARRLAREHPTALYSSPLSRAWATAEVIGAAVGIEPQSDDGLREVDVGSWEGMTADEVRERDPDGHARWVAGETGWSDGETYAAMCDRIQRALDALAARHPGARERIVAVTHGGPVRAAATRAVGLTAAEGRLAFANGPNASLTVLDVRPERWAIVSYADAGHLASLVPAEHEVAAAQPGTQ